MLNSSAKGYRPIHTRKTSPLKLWWNLIRLDPERNYYADRSAKKLFWQSINGEEWKP